MIDLHYFPMEDILMALNLEKVRLEKKGDSRVLSSNEAHAKLLWKTKVDLDLYAIALPKGVASTKKKGFFGKIADAIGGDSGSASNEEIQVNYQNRSRMLRESFPYITLDKDAGVGDKVDGDFNEENLHFYDISKHDHILVVANIFNKNTNFSQYNGGVTITCGSEEIHVPLTETKQGSWCTVARIDNTGSAPKLINVNKTQSSKPKVSEFI